MPATSFGEAEWINKDFTNTTGHMRNDLEWLILGHIKDAIEDIYSPSEFPNVKIEEEGPVPVTRITWSGGQVDDETTVHCGIKIDWWDLPAQRFKSGAHWSLDGDTKEQVPGCASINMSVQGEAVVVSVANTADPSDPALDVSDFSYAYFSTPRALADLTWNNPSITWISMPFSGTVPSGGSIVLGGIPLPRRGPYQGDPYLVMQMEVNFTGAPSGNAGHIIVQRSIMEAVPATSRPTPFVLALIIASIGAVLIVRRRARVPARSS
jgi:hypothetical protein